MADFLDHELLLLFLIVRVVSGSMFNGWLFASVPGTKPFAYCKKLSKVDLSAKIIPNLHRLSITYLV